MTSFSKQWQVTREESGMRLLQFLRSKLEEKCSLRFLKQSLERNLCFVNGRAERFASTLVGRGDVVEFIYRPPQVSTSRKFLSPILYEDDDFLIIDKAAGVNSEDTGLLEDLKSKRSLTYLELAHRLDKETSGVLIFIKSEEAKEAISRLFKNRKILKSYFAIVQGIPKESKGRIINYLGKTTTYVGQNLWGEVAKEKGALAITEWEVVRKGEVASLLACYPHTGRTHQIRVHLAGMGYPILGDSLYHRGKSIDYQPKRCLLHASKIEFTHPVSGKNVCVESALPVDFIQALDTKSLFVDPSPTIGP